MLVLVLVVTSKVHMVRVYLLLTSSKCRILTQPFLLASLNLGSSNVVRFVQRFVLLPNDHVLATSVVLALVGVSFNLGHTLIL
jgi:hypothetical protein